MRNLQWLPLLPVAALFTAIAPVHAVQYATAEEAAKRAFPEATAFKERELQLTGDEMKALPPDAKVRQDITTSAGKVGNIFSVKNTETDGWRISFELSPEGARVAELRCVLLGDAGPISETWLYRWTA